MWIVISPLDVLFFRHAHPFGAGEAHRATSMFPPLPTTVQGAIRTAALAHELSGMGVSFEEYNRLTPDTASVPETTRLRDALGDATTYGQLRLRGPFLLARTGKDPATLWFPCPLDVLVENDTQRPVALQPAPNAFPHARWHAPDPTRTDFPTPLLGIGEQLKEPEFRFIGLDQVTTYLQGQPLGTVSERMQRTDLDFREQRFGIQIDQDTGTVATQMLYSAEVIRLKSDDALLLEVECPHLPPRGILRLGGEARAARYETVDLERDIHLAGFHRLLYGDTRTELTEKVQAERRFKLFLLTPAIFKNGWLPDFINPTTLRFDPEDTLPEKYPALQGIKFRLVSAAVGKPMHIGGWNMAANAPRRMFKAIPAGSTYYFELSEGDVEALFDAFHFQPLPSDAPRGEELAKLGFGLTLIGRWNYV